MLFAIEILVGVFQGVIRILNVCSMMFFIYGMIEIGSLFYSLLSCFFTLVSFLCVWAD